MRASSGSLIMVVAPSGAGKTTRVNARLARDGALELSISHTTRAPRPSESNGREYHFVARAEFEALRARGEFLESAEVHGHLYGTSRAWIEQRLAAGRDLLLEIDWQGARQIKAVFAQAIGIFILPPSIDALEARLKHRGQDAPAVIASRLLAAGAEIAHAPEFDYVIVNEDFELALAQLAAVVAAARLRYPAQAARHRELFAQLGLAG
ncbi:MAG: guanylate kinase [Betaproteobacteria bacterium]